MESFLNAHAGGTYTPPNSPSGPASILLELANQQAAMASGTSYQYTITTCPQWPCSGRR